MEYLQTTASARYPPEELFQKRTKRRFPWKPLKKSCFNNDRDLRPKTLSKHNLNVLKQVTYITYMLKIISLTGTHHSDKFWGHFESVFEIRDFC